MKTSSLGASGIRWTTRKIISTSLQTDNHTSILSLNGDTIKDQFYCCSLAVDLQLEDCALQLCRHTGTHNDYGIYLDLESSIDEQMDDLEGFTEK